MSSRFQKFHHGTKNKTSDSHHVDNTVTKIESMDAVTKVVRTHTMKRRRKYSVGQIEIAMCDHDNIVKCLVHHNHGNTTLFIYFAGITYGQMVNRIMVEFPDTVYPDKCKVTQMALSHTPVASDSHAITDEVSSKKLCVKSIPNHTDRDVSPLWSISSRNPYINFTQNDDDIIEAETNTEVPKPTTGKTNGKSEKTVEKTPKPIADNAKKLNEVTKKPLKSSMGIAKKETAKEPPRLSKKKKAKEAIASPELPPEIHPNMSGDYIEHAVALASAYMRDKAIQNGDMGLSDIGDILEGFGEIITAGSAKTKERHIRELNKKLLQATAGQYTILRVEDLMELIQLAVDHNAHEAIKRLAMITQEPSLAKFTKPE